MPGPDAVPAHYDEVARMSWAVDDEGTVFGFPSMERIGTVDESGSIELDEDQDD